MKEKINDVWLYSGSFEQFKEYIVNEVLFKKYNKNQECDENNLRSTT